MSKYIGDVSAYAYAVSKGYTGTEEEFAELMASYADVGQTAVDAKDAAVAAKTDAQTAATTATNKASEATTAAQTATTKAGEAQTSAQTASSKASEASQSASTASQKATEASQSATNAGQSAQTAEQAKTASQTARGLAESARDSAIQAKNDAESARDEAQDIVDGINAKAEQIDQNTTDITELKNDGVAPSAEQLLSKNTAADSVPYLFRQTGGDGADREYVDAIVGGTVVWNQIVSDSEKSGSHTPSNNSISDVNIVHAHFVGGHVYYISCVFRIDTTRTNARPYCQSGTGAGQTYGKFGTNRYANQTGVRFDGTIVPSADANSLVVGITTSSGGERLTNADVWHFDKFMAIDLTMMFGSEIANYINNLDIPYNREFFTNLFTGDYYPYNAGELKSVEGVSAHETVGFNQWDEEWELGSYDTTTGEPVTYANTIRSKNAISVIPSITYNFVISAYGVILFYDAEGEYISYVSVTQNSHTVITPINARYMRFRMSTDYGTTYKNDICINISDPARNGEYEPYVKRSYPLDNSLTLRGIPKLSDGKMYFDGDRYLPDGTVTKKYGIVDLGTLDWRVNNAGTRFIATLVSAVKFPELNYAGQNAVSNLITAKYMTVGGRDGYDATYDKAISGSFWNLSNYLQVNDSAYTDATTFKAAMSGVYLVYKLATPTTEEADPYLHLQQCGPNGTEEFVSTGIVPVGHETRYPENLRAKIEGLPWDFSSLIAPTEKTATASRNYTTGNLLIMGNVLYKVTANIANGGTITPNTNVTATTLSEILSALAQ